MKTPHMACFLLALLLTIVMVSCSRSGSGEIPIGEQELPDMVMRDAVYTLSQTDDSPMVMQASLISIYGTGRDTVLENVGFRRGDSLEGSCAKATVASDNKHATLTGDVRVRITDDDSRSTIETDSVVWDGTDNSLTCYGEVTVTYGDGTRIRAMGFSAVPDENLYEFGTILEGTFTE